MPSVRKYLLNGAACKKERHRLIQSNTHASIASKCRMCAERSILNTLRYVSDMLTSMSIANSAFQQQHQYHCNLCKNAMYLKLSNVYKSTRIRLIYYNFWLVSRIRDCFIVYIYVSFRSILTVYFVCASLVIVFFFALYLLSIYLIISFLFVIPFAFLKIFPD